ncbi:MAG: hypothetical protein WAR37_02380 [Candidatus Microsaccharimonas sp.]
MPNPSIAPDNDTQDANNRIQDDYDQKFKDIADREERGDFNNTVNNYDKTADSKQEDANINKARQGESEPGFVNNFTGGNNKKTKVNAVNPFRRKSVIGTIIAVILFGGGGLSLFFTPGLLLIQIQAALVDRFDTRLSVLQESQSRLYASKITNKATSGYCGSKVTIKCKFSTMSAKNVELFKAAKIDVIGTETIGGRIKPDHFVFDGKEIPVEGFNTELNTNPQFRSAILRAYNPRFAAFADKAWGAWTKYSKVSKAPIDLGDTDEERAKALQDISKNGRETLNTGGLGDNVTCDENGKCTRQNPDGTTQELSDAEKKQLEDARKATGELAGDVSEDGKKALTAISTGSPLSVASKSIGIIGAADTACQARAALRGIGYAAKTIRALQLARYAMAFVNVGSQIRAGDAKPEDVAYLGGILTNVAYDVTSGLKRKAAMDAAGMKYAMYGETGGFKGRASGYLTQFMAGGGVTGDLIIISNTIDNALPKDKAQATCDIVSNGWVQLGSTIGGVALLLSGVGTGPSIAKAVFQTSASIAVSVALAILPDLLKDIVAGNTTLNLDAEGAGNAIASGFGTSASGVARAGGGSLVSVEQAVETAKYNNQLIAQYAEQERSEKSPFDATSRYTFVGSLVGSLAPAISSNPAQSAFSLFGSLVPNTLSSIIPKTSAMSEAELRENYELCTDPDYKELGIATDPFCNPIYTIPSEYYSDSTSSSTASGISLAATNGGDGVAIASAIDGEYNEDTGRPLPGTKYEEIVTKCIENTEPVDNTSGVCIINADNAKYFKFYAALTADDGMEGNVNVSSSAGNTTYSAVGRPEGAIGYGDEGGWTLADGADYSQYECDPLTPQYTGAPDGIVTTQNPSGDGARAKIRLCELTPNRGDTNNGSNLVASVISTNAKKLIDDARKANINISLGDGMRLDGGSSAYFSQHGVGLAMDLDVTPGTPFCSDGVPSWSSGWGSRAGAESACKNIGGKEYEAYQWLLENAPKYGFYNFDPEPWHWSTSGM